MKLKDESFLYFQWKHLNFLSKARNGFINSFLYNMVLNSLSSTTKSGNWADDPSWWRCATNTKYNSDYKALAWKKKNNTKIALMIFRQIPYWNSMVVKPWTGTATSNTVVHGFGSQLCYWSCFLPIHTSGGSRQWLKSLSPCHPQGETCFHFQLPSLYYEYLWNEPADDFSSSLALSN